MINYKELIQRTEEWYQMKWGKVGGTLSKGLHVKSDTLLIDILSQRLEEYDLEESYSNSFSSDAMLRGQDLEPFAREYLSNYTGLQFLESGWLQSEENELLGLSPDGITEDETVSCEIKCFARKKHIEVLLENDIPIDNINQCLQYFVVNPKLERHYYIAFRSESVKHFIKELTLDSEINLGTKSKPNLKTVREWRDITLSLADELLTQVKTKEVELQSNF